MDNDRPTVLDYATRRRPEPPFPVPDFKARRHRSDGIAMAVLIAILIAAIYGGLGLFWAINR